MEVLDSPVLNSAFNFSSFQAKFSGKTCNGRNLHKFHISICKFRKARLSPCHLPSSGTRIFQISARFGETSRRRNSLRKKSIDDQRVRKNLISSDPDTDFQNPNPSFNYKLSHGDASEKDDLFESSISEDLKDEILGECNLLNELENWVVQCKKEAEYWGIGSSPIFTVFQDLDHKVQKVKVDESEILRRNKDFEDFTEVNSKILHAKKLAEEMENGKNAIPRNSSVAKFVLPSEESNFITSIGAVIVRHDLIPKLPVLGKSVLCCFLVFWVVKKVFAFGNNKEVAYTEMEKEMMGRKMKASKENEMLEKGSVEVLVENLEKPLVSFEKPKLDKQELMSRISKAKASKDKLEVLDSSMGETAESIDFNNKIREIRKMAKVVGEIEAGKRPDIVQDEKETRILNEKVVEDDTKESLSFLNNLPNDSSRLGEHNDGTEILGISAETNGKNSEFPGSDVSMDYGVMRASTSTTVKNIENTSQDLTENESSISSEIKVTGATFQSSDVPNGKPCMMENGTGSRKPRVIRSVKEAKEFLSRKHGEKELSQEPLVKTVQGSESFLKLQSDEQSSEDRREELDDDNKVSHSASFNGTSEFVINSNSCEKYSLEDKDPLPDKKDYQDCSKSTGVLKDEKPLPIEEGNPVNSHEGYKTGIHQTPLNSSDPEPAETEQPIRIENWMDKNFHEFEPIVKKIGDGFRDSYTVAREKVSQESSTKTDITQPGSYEDDSELEWMKDDKLRDIVFRVRDNELAGRDPFCLIDDEDKAKFFQGLEKKVEKENAKLSHLHEWLHSNIENLHYGADGISLYDPPEKIIPRWKGPPLEKNPDFLKNYSEQRKALFSEKAASPFPVKKGEHKSAESTANGNLVPSSVDSNANKSKTVIESSDGSVRPGKKSGKEYWQHTKKWSRGFLESYNTETDPEVKAVMKDMGKDLDRWITEEEIQEANDLMNRLPERNKKFMEKKLNKLKREMELFGPQAVVSKYREYGEEKEEDYLWWLDLPHVLCIELYTVENVEQRVGFYALEMAADLELEPKPHHVIAFEDAADCKNLSYIIQAHLDMLGNGNAFIVPRPPKDAFREAKANGFGVTVIRKGELKLNVDQTLEEVEEQICEIGSKMYHDKITKERSVDISSLTKGVFGLKSRPNRRRKRAKRMLKRSSKKQS